MVVNKLKEFESGIQLELDKLTKSGVNRNTALQQIRTRLTKAGGAGALGNIAAEVKKQRETTSAGQKATESAVNPRGIIAAGEIPGVTTDTRKTTDTTGITDTTEQVTDTGVTDFGEDTTPTLEETEAEKTLRERVAERIAGRRTREEQLKAEQEAAGRGEVLELKKGFREEAARVQEDIENISAGLEAEGGAITKIAASRIREARSAPLRETLSSLIKGQELTSDSLAEIDTSISAILQARELDRQDAANSLAAQIESSDLSDEEKTRLTTQLGIQTEQAKQRDELETFRQKEQIKVEVQQKDIDSLAKTGLTASQALEASKITEDFEVKEDSIAGQAIRKLFKEGKTPSQIRQILGLSTDATGKISDETFTRQEKLRKEFEANATVKNYLEATQQFAGVISSLGTKTGAGDMAAIFSFMKTLDPSSVVRESEFDAAARSIGVGEQAKNFFSGDKLLTGAFLTDTGRETFVKIATQLFENRKSAFDERASRFIDLAKEAGANPKSVVLDFDSIPGVATDLTDDDLAPIGINSSDEELINFINKGGGEGGQFNTSNIQDAKDEDIGNLLDGNFNVGDQTSSTKVQGILGNLQANVLPKGGDNPVLGLSGGSLTFRTNNPLAITATSAGTAERLTNKFGAIPNLFSPDSADNLVLNFNTVEEGLKAGRQLLDSKGTLTINKLLESHTGTAATGHKAQAKKLGIDLNRTYNSLTEEEKNKVIEAIKIGEGFRAGTLIS